MADALFRYLLMARKRRQSFVHRLVMQEEGTLRFGAEQVVQAYAVRVDVLAEEEHVERVRGCSPVSRSGSVQFFAHPQPTRPQHPVGVRQQATFPIKGTQRTERCSPCTGTGEVACPACREKGKVLCGRCDGMGVYVEAGPPPVVEDPCQRCQGRRLVICSRCEGTSRVRHQECAGEGVVLAWDQVVYTHSPRRLVETVLPASLPADLIERLEALLEAEAPLFEPDQDALARRLGGDWSAARSVLRTAERTREKLVRSIRANGQQSLFTTTDLTIVPVASCTDGHAESRARRTSWVLGRGDSAVEILPEPEADPRKILGLAGLFTVAAGGVGWAVLAASWWAAPILIGSAAAATGFRDVAIGRDPISTIAVLPDEKRTPLYLTCLAMLGAYLRKLDVLDASYRPRLDLLAGVEDVDLSCSLVVKCGRRLIRFVEVPSGATLSEEEQARMRAVVDGVIRLQDGGSSSPIPGAPFESVLRISAEDLPVDSSGSSAGGVSLERIRQCFVARETEPLDWPAVFARLWAPVEQILSQLPRESRVGRSPTPAL